MAGKKEKQENLSKKNSLVDQFEERISKQKEAQNLTWKEEIQLACDTMQEMNFNRHNTLKESIVHKISNLLNRNAKGVSTQIALWLESGVEISGTRLHFQKKNIGSYPAAHLFKVLLKNVQNTAQKEYGKLESASFNQKNQHQETTSKAQEELMTKNNEQKGDIDTIRRRKNKAKLNAEDDNAHSKKSDVVRTKNRKSAKHKKKYNKDYRHSQNQRYNSSKDLLYLLIFFTSIVIICTAVLKFLSEKQSPKTNLCALVECNQYGNPIDYDPGRG